MAGEIFMVAHLTDYFVGEKVRGSQGLKWPKTHYGVVALLGDVRRDQSEKFDVDAAMAALGWQRITETPPTCIACANGDHPQCLGGQCECIHDPRTGTGNQASNTEIGSVPSAAQKDSN